jgi:hypothetical protein
MNAGHHWSEVQGAAAGGRQPIPCHRLAPQPRAPGSGQPLPFTPTASNVTDTDIAARLSDLSHGQLRHRHCSLQRPPKPTLLLSGSHAHRPALPQLHAIATNTSQRLALNTVTDWPLGANVGAHTPRSARPDHRPRPPRPPPEEPGPASLTRSRSQQTTNQRQPR